MDAFVQTIAAQDTWDFVQVLFLLSLGTGLGFWLWWRSLRSARAIEDVATSRIRSAAQGYVELSGRQLPVGDAPLSAPLTGRPCTWWAYEIERRERRRDSKGRTRTTWVTVEKKTSPHLIRLRDDTGEALVNPAGAEVVPEVRSRWYGSSRRPAAGPDGGGSALFGRYRYTERLMRPGEPLYAIGHFETRTGEVGPSERTRQMTELLAEWKRDRESLAERFDADGDGRVDLDEWEAVRAAAEHTITRRAARAALDPAVNLLLRPPDGRPFLLSPKSQEALARHFRGRSILWVLVFLVCGGLLGAVLTARFAG